MLTFRTQNLYSYIMTIRLVRHSLIEQTWKDMETGHKRYWKTFKKVLKSVSQSNLYVANMSQVIQRHTIAETSLECSLYAMSVLLSDSLVYSVLHRNELASWAEWQSNDSEFQTEGALTLKAFTDNASAMWSTDGNCLPDDLKKLWQVSLGCQFLS